MGTFSVTVRVRGSARAAREVKALVDTGATHTTMPGNLMKELGVVPVDRISFELADERIAELPVGEVRLQLNGRRRTVLAVFGPEHATPLLGATTLELFNLGVDPVRRRLVRVRGLLKRALVDSRPTRFAAGRPQAGSRPAA
jgi:clan AA aspartic protease